MVLGCALAESSASDQSLGKAGSGSDAAGPHRSDRESQAGQSRADRKAVSEVSSQDGVGGAAVRAHGAGRRAEHGPDPGPPPALSRPSRRRRFGREPKRRASSFLVRPLFVFVVLQVPTFLREVREAQKRRKDYELKLQQAADEKKKKDAENGEPEEDSVPLEEATVDKVEEEKKEVQKKEVPLATVSKLEEEDLPLAQSVQSLNTTALEAQVNDGLRKRKGKKKKKAAADIPLNQTH